MKRILSVLLATVMVISVVPLGVSASGTCGDNLTWTLDDGTLTISGAGAMIDSPTVWSEYASVVTEIVVEDGVTTIGNYAFENFTKLIDVSLPDTLIDIGRNAFVGCTSLVSIVVPESVRVYGDSDAGANAIFSGCTSLQNVQLSSTADSSSEWASMFYNCTSLKEAILPDGMSNVGGYMFNNCSALSNVVLPDSVTKIGIYAFQNCTTLKSITIPEGVTYIGDRAFNACTALETVEIPSTLKQLYPYAFCACSSLKSISLPSSFVEIDEWTFYGCAALQEVNLSEGLLVIDKNAFGYCSALESIVIPDSVTTINTNAFSKCTGLKELVLGESVTTISSTAFYKCSGLTEVTVKCESLTENFSDGVLAKLNLGPKVTGSVECISDYLKEINVDEDNPTYCDVDGILFSKDMSVLYRYPAAKEGSSYTVPDSVQTLIGKSFRNTDLNELVIGSGVASIEAWAFEGSNVKNITFTGNAPTFGANIFYSITANCYYPEGDDTWTADNMLGYGGTITWMSSAADDFRWSVSADGILTITGNCDMPIYESYESVPWYNDASSIVGIVIDEGITGISQYAFYGFTQLQSVSIPSTVTYIGDYAFSHCELLSSVSFPEGLTSIGSGAFEFCSALNGVTLTDNLSAIGDVAFRFCTTLQSIDIPEGITNLGAVFVGCSNLKDVNLPNTITTLTRTFQNCTSLENITLPNSLTNLGQQVFEGCTSLTTVKFTGDAPDIYYMNIEGYTQFCEVTADCYYPENNSTWDDFAKGGYGGTLTWNGYTYEGSGGGDGDLAGEEDGADSGQAGGSGSGSGDGESEESEGNENSGSGGSGSSSGSESGGDTEGSDSGNEGGTAGSGTSVNITVNNVGGDVSGAVITEPEAGWAEGSNTFTVACDTICFVIISYDNGLTYTRLAALPSEEAYSFTAENVTENTIIAIIVAGDANGDGSFTNADITRLRAAYAGKVELDAVQSIAADVNGDNAFTNADVTRLRAVYAEKVQLTW